MTAKDLILQAIAANTGDNEEDDLEEFETGPAGKVERTKLSDSEEDRLHKKAAADKGKKIPGKFKIGDRVLYKASGVGEVGMQVTGARDSGKAVVLTLIGKGMQLKNVPESAVTKDTNEDLDEANIEAQTVKGKGFEIGRGSKPDTNVVTVKGATNQTLEALRRWVKSVKGIVDAKGSANGVTVFWKPGDRGYRDRGLMNDRLKALAQSLKEFVTQVEGLGTPNQKMKMKREELDEALAPARALIEEALAEEEALDEGFKVLTGKKAGTPIVGAVVVELDAFPTITPKTVGSIQRLLMSIANVEKVEARQQVGGEPVQIIVVMKTGETAGRTIPLRFDLREIAKMQRKLVKDIKTTMRLFPEIK